MPQYKEYCLTFVISKFDTLCQIIEDEDLFAMLDSTVESGQKYSEEHKSSVPLMYHYYETEYLGAAHGVAGIFTMLMW